MKYNEKWDWVKKDDEEFKYTLEKIFESNDNLCIIGPGGVGKSILLQMAADMLEGNTVVLSTTGASAANLASEDIASSTIHRFFGLKGLDIFSRTPRINPEKSDLMNNVDTILIDEVSMMSSSLMETILKLLRTYRSFNFKSLPRIILFGDVLQLPPVVKDNVPEIKKYYDREFGGRKFFFGSNLYSDLHFERIHLNTIYRQTDDNYKSILNRIRQGKQTKADLKVINKRVVDADAFIEEHPFMMYLVSTNRRADSVNMQYYDPDEFDYDTSVPTMEYKGSTKNDFDFKEARNLSTNVSLTVGMPVMCLKNSSTPTEEDDRTLEYNYQNGTMGIIKELKKDTVVIEKKDGSITNVKYEEWTQFSYDYDTKDGKVSAKVKGTFRQIACKPALAVVIHKSQGMTLDNVYLETGWCPAGSLYTALSRCTSLEGLGLKRPIKMKDVVVNEEALAFLGLLDDKETVKKDLIGGDDFCAFANTNIGESKEDEDSDLPF